MAWYDPDTLQPLAGDEAGKRLQAVDAWADNNRAGVVEGGDDFKYQGPKAVIWGRTLGWVSADGYAWTLLPEPLGDRAVNGGICCTWDAENEQYIS